MSGDELKAALKELGWSQRELSRRVRVHPNTANDWARGRAVVPEAIAKYVGLALEVKRLAARLAKGAV